MYQRHSILRNAWMIHGLLHFHRVGRSTWCLPMGCRDRVSYKSPLRRRTLREETAPTGRGLPIRLYYFLIWFCRDVTILARLRAARPVGPPNLVW